MLSSRLVRQQPVPPRKQRTRSPLSWRRIVDPVGNGFVASLARPGGNITGLSTLAPELSGKRLELLKEIVPRLSRVAVFGTPTNPGNAQALKETELAAGALGVTASIPGRTRVPRILRLHSETQARGGLTLSLCWWRARRSVLSEHRLQTSR